MHYISDSTIAFDCIEHIARDVEYGWLLRIAHANGASFFFIVVNCHILRGLSLSSYTTPRIAAWCVGVIIYLLMMATAFMGYVLPWGQMSFWGATVITNLFSVIPIYGKEFVIWLWGAYAVSGSTLIRFYALHFLLPFIILLLVIIHIIFLHESGSSNPLTFKLFFFRIFFSPYYIIKDLLGLLIFALIYSSFIFFMPDYLGHPDNYVKANPLVTPAHIVPEWYFLPFYAILRAIPNKVIGVVLLVFAILVLFLLPFINKPIIKGEFNLIDDFFLTIHACITFFLGFLGSQLPVYPFALAGLQCTVLYFFILLILLPYGNMLYKLPLRIKSIQ